MRFTNCAAHCRTAKVTLEEFLDCLRHADANRDGLVSQQELQNALRVLGLRFTGWKAWRAIANADRNCNRSVDNEEELKQLVEYALRNWDIVVE